MIVELFGPPAAGKTTLAHALAGRLQEQGHAVELILSYRPTESSVVCGTATGIHDATLVLRRLTRPVAEMLTTLGHPVSQSRAIRLAANLMCLLPPKNLMWFIRLSQYILRLSHSWQRASQASHIVLLDQAFVQVVCSLVLLGRKSDESLIIRALDCTPRSDVLIRIDAPYPTLEHRLHDRMHLQSRIERLFELDLKTNLESVHVVDRIDGLLRQRQIVPICATSIDQHSLHETTERIRMQIEAKPRAAQWADGSRLGPKGQQTVYGAGMKC